MSKLAIAIAAAFTLLLTEHAEATAMAVKPETNASLIEKDRLLVAFSVRVRTTPGLLLA
jgi:hypothetical protein